MENDRLLLPKEIILMIFKYNNDDFLTYSGVSKWCRKDILLYILPTNEKLQIRIIKILSKNNRFTELNQFLHQGSQGEFKKFHSVIIDWFIKCRIMEPFQILLKLPENIFNITDNDNELFRKSLRNNQDNLVRLLLNDKRIINATKYIKRYLYQEVSFNNWHIGTSYLIGVENIKFGVSFFTQVLRKDTGGIERTIILKKKTDLKKIYEHFASDTDRFTNDKDIMTVFLSEPSIDPFKCNNVMQNLAKNGFIELFIMLVNKLQNKFTEDYKKSLSRACENNQVSMVKMLLQDKRYKAKTINNSLFKAVTYYHDKDRSEIIHMLLNDERADPTFNDNCILYDLSGSFSSSHQSYDNIIAYISDKRVDPSINDNEALIELIERGCEHCVEALISHDKVNPKNKSFILIETVLKLRSKFDPKLSKRILKILINSHKIDFSVNDSYVIRQPLFYNGDTSRYFSPNSIVKLLFKSGEILNIDPSAKHNEALITAVKYSHNRSLELLLTDSRVDPIARNNLALKIIIKKCCSHKICFLEERIQTLHILLSDNRVDLTSQNDFAIRYASQHDFSGKVVAYLLQFHKNSMALNGQAIINASKVGNFNALKLLLKDNRVDPSVAHNCPLRIAAKNGMIEIVKLLLNDKRVNPKDKNYQAIRLAISKGYAKILTILLTDSRIDKQKIIKQPCKELQINYLLK